MNDNAIGGQQGLTKGSQGLTKGSQGFTQGSQKRSQGSQCSQKNVLKCCIKGTVQCSRHHTVGFATLHKTRRARSSLVATSKLDVIEQEARPHVRKGSKTELKARVGEEKSSINASFEAVLIVAIVEEIKIDINIKQH